MADFYYVQLLKLLIDVAKQTLRDMGFGLYVKEKKSPITNLKVHSLIFHQQLVIYS